WKGRPGGRPRTGGPPHNSEDQLQRELNGSRRGPCSCHLAERAAGRTGIGTEELGMVQRVEPIGAELELEPLPVACSRQHGVQIILSVLADSGKEAAQNAQVIVELYGGVRHECIDIEPFVNAALATRKRDVVRGSSQESVAETQRRASLALEQTRQLPAADYFGGNSPGTSHWLVCSEGQLIDARDDQSMGTVLAGNHLFRHRI